MSSADLDWWAEKLSNPTTTPLTRDYPETAGDNVPKRPIEAVEILAAQSEGLKLLSENTKTSNVLLAAVFALVSRLTGDEDVLVASNAGRDGKQAVLRLSVTPGEQTFADLIKKVEAAADEAAQRPVDFDQVRQKANASCLFRFAVYECLKPGASMYSTIENVDLLLDYAYSPQGSLQLVARYNQRLFSSARIAGILAQLEQFISNATQDPGMPFGKIEFITNAQRKLLPDPTTDLEWSNFRGAIHDIFAANAEKHPDRTCVVETRTETDPERVFTYRQIHEASNILAHHLVSSGLERGDVVMIYSYRGVDLVVAVMGTLKAGGTFSVLDPQYPPDRQNIYLEVAKPRALVIIDKATQEAGGLDEKVSTYISQELDLRTTVPALRLHNDGSLSGGNNGGGDLFASIQSLKAKGPGVVVGPDSTPTLSFTSGSEGKPKGVRGRHYSLAYYFDWMSQTFKLGPSDKFTMLSGIAHDPIQRDMFTPLFLGAQLLVPSKNDIQNERLAEWMKAHGATVTHLTPAMGQILVGGATAKFEALHHAFFVGDILIKRDCRSLQNLAPNVNIVNMYGTTETQRAVSFFEIPSRNAQEGFLDGLKDVIPAGRGMYNVQLLVVNRHDRTKTCAIGEVGEIYVRAGGLAEGYLGAPELTATKFVQNWFPGHERGLEADLKRFDGLKNEKWANFYLGPRDRLYRSGDLGRYTPSGDVECSGRADDQVKIRGFRIELGEIDTHLSQHPLVRENVTLVRRDKFEERTLVSYVVPNIPAWKKFTQERGMQDEQDDGSLAGRFERFRLLQAAVQEYLRTKLAVYAVPSIIVPMRAMPLNPNGKIDKPKLPFPDPAMLSMSRRRKSSMMQTLTEGQLELATVWANLVPGLIAKSIRPSESFFDLGGDSMKAQQLAYQIRRRIGVDLPISELYKRPTLKDMAAIIDRKKAGESLIDDGEADVSANGSAVVEVSYGADAVELAQTLPKSFPTSTYSASSSAAGTGPTAFLTGATGFLGCFILRDLLQRTNPAISHVYVLIRARDAAAAHDRLKRTCQAYGVWSASWSERITCIPGSLGPEHFGLDQKSWQTLCEQVDVVIHNGAQVHWINTYETLKPANVLGTIAALQLCSVGKPKLFAFVSSTSVLDHDYYVSESAARIAAGEEGISEDDDLMGSSKSLTTGYGQSKWVSEYLAREAGRRGLRGCVIRPGYVLGDSKTGVTNTDDFLIRMLKGCVQLHTRPNINNTVNMVPVDHVARTVVACAFFPAVATEQGGVCVAQITGHPRLRFNQYLAALETYGYNAKVIDYVPWASSLENYVSNHTDFALMPLFTFVANDLPSNTLAPELDDRNAETSLYKDQEWTGQDVSAGSGVTKNIIGMYLAYLVSIGFLPPPTGLGEHDVDGRVNGHARQPSTSTWKALPKVKVSDEQKAALTNVGGRGAIA